MLVDLGMDRKYALRNGPSSGDPLIAEANATTLHAGNRTWKDGILQETLVVGTMAEDAPPRLILSQPSYYTERNSMTNPAVSYMNDATGSLSSPIEGRVVAETIRSCC